MQLALDVLTAWAKSWCVTINREKTTATLFSLSTKEFTGKLMLGSTPLKLEDQQTYLGVTFDKRMTWKQHIQNAEAKARRKLNIMRKLAGTHWGANEKILKTIYQGSVRPYLEYGSCSWMTAAKSHQQNLNRVQNQALRIITGAMRSTPIQKNGGYYQHSSPQYQKRVQGITASQQVQMLKGPPHEHQAATVLLRTAEKIQLRQGNQSARKETPGKASSARRVPAST